MRGILASLIYGWLVLVFVPFGWARNTIWLETEQFAQRGGWVNDAQFVDQMGSPYLLAIGLHGPVADATTSVRVPQSGTYRVWARVRDWVPEFSPGRFQLVVGGKTMPHVFGQSKQRGWIWENDGAWCGFRGRPVTACDACSKKRHQIWAFARFVCMMTHREGAMRGRRA